MIIQMNEGKSRINIISGEINLLYFQTSKIKDEFLYNLYSEFKVKHKRDLWGQYVSLTNDDFDKIEPKNYDVHILPPNIDNLNDNKNFQKLLSKYISQLECSTDRIDILTNEIKNNFYELIKEVSSSMHDSKLEISDDIITIDKIIKGLDLKYVDKASNEFTTAENKYKYLELMQSMSKVDKTNLYVILYPETGLGIAEYKYIVSSIKKIQGTVLIITNEIEIGKLINDYEKTLLVLDDYKTIVLSDVLNEYLKLNPKGVDDFLSDVILSCMYSSKNKFLRLISNILLDNSVI